MDMTPYSDYWNQVFPTYMEHWHANLLPHTMPATMMRMTREETESLLAINFMKVEELVGDKGEEETMKQIRRHRGILEDLEQRIDNAILGYGKSGFVRLNSRSPKDSWLGVGSNGTFECRNAQHAMDLMKTSERIYDDLANALAQDTPMFFVIRPWLDIDPHREFRIIKHREHLSVSQYFYDRIWQEGAVSIPPIILLRELQRFVYQLGDKLPANVVLDVVVTPRFDVQSMALTRDLEGAIKLSPRGHVSIEIMIIELNPFCTFTDPCLFDWGKDPMDHSEMRFLVEDPASPKGYKVHRIC